MTNVVSNSASSRARASAPLLARPGVPGALIITGLALAIRFSTLSLQSFWLDEAYTEHLVHLGFGAMLSAIPKSESTPPLYYVIAWGQTHVFGYSEFALRSVSALAGAATAAVVYALAARVSGMRAAVIAGLLVTVSPLMVWFSQEARAYSLAALLATASVLCLTIYLDTLDRRWLGAWAATAALGLCTHYFVAFVVLPELAWLVWRHRARREVQLSVGLVVLVALALVPLALAQRGTGHADYIAQGSLTTRTLQVPKQFLIGYASPLQALTGPLAVALVLTGALWPLIRDRATVSRGAALTLAAGLCCVLAPIALALVGVDFLDTRNMLPALPALIAVAAVGFAAPRSWPWGAAAAGALAVLFAVIVLLVDTNVQYQRTDWRGASAALGPVTRPRVLVVTPGDALLPVQAFERGVTPLLGPVRVSEIDVVGLSPQSTGAGLGTGPRPSSPLPLPPGFHLVGTTYNRVFTVLRFLSATPVTVAPALVARSEIGVGPAATLLQVPAARPH